MSIDVTLVVNLHDEGLGCRASLGSAYQAMEYARAAELKCEMLVILDAADHETVRAAERTSDSATRLVRVEVGDLGLARNAGVANAVGEYVAFLDGDDLWGERWIAGAQAAAALHQSRTRSQSVWHPSISFFFGRQASVYHHVSSIDPSFNHHRFRMHNSWTALCLAPRSLLVDIPYRPNYLDLGFGFEDWSWNEELLRRGIAHRVVDDTCHFIHKRQGSLLGLSQSAIRTPYRSL